MPAQRSTTLGLALNHCPRAVDYYDAGTEYERGHFQGGVAAHAVLQELGEADRDRRPVDPRIAADRVVAAMLTGGRSFDGGPPEPPMKPEQAIDGADLALRFAANHEWLPGADYEVGLAVTRDWKPCDYRSPDAYYKAILDVRFPVAIEGDEDTEPMTGIGTRDYKSAWRSSASDLDSLQIKGQAAILYAHNPGVDVLVREIANLRTGAVHRAETWMDDAGKAAVTRWQEEIDLAIAAAETRGPDGRRLARPGIGCGGCPYVLVCDAAAVTLTAEGIPTDPKAAATAYAVHTAAAARLEAIVKAHADGGEIDIDGGTVGFTGKPERVARATMIETIARAWFTVGGDDWLEWAAKNERTVTLLTTAKLGSSAVAAIAAKLHPFVRGAGQGYKDARAAFSAACLETVATPKFGIHATKAEPVNGDGAPAYVDPAESYTADLETF